MFKRIVMALLDESEAAELAAVGRRLAERDATVLSLHVRKVSPAGGEPERYDDAEEVAAAGAAAARRLGLPAEAEALMIDRDREVGRAVADVALGWRADVVVMGSRRLGDLSAAVHGSVSHEVIRLAACPVVIAGERLLTLRDIVLAVDGSPAAAAAEKVVERIATDSGAHVTVVHVPTQDAFASSLAAAWYVAPPTDDAIADGAVERLREAGVEAAAWQRRPLPPIADAVARVADAVDAGLVVVGSRGLGDVAALIRGSVSHELLHATGRSVLVTKATGPDSRLHRD